MRFCYLVLLEWLDSTDNRNTFKSKVSPGNSPQTLFSIKSINILLHQQTKQSNPRAWGQIGVKLLPYIFLDSIFYWGSWSHASCGELHHSVSSSHALDGPSQLRGPWQPAWYICRHLGCEESWPAAVVSITPQSCNTSCFAALHCFSSPALSSWVQNAFPKVASFYLLARQLSSTRNPRPFLQQL